MNAVILVTALAVAAVLAFMPRLRQSRAWRATVTPLSSIMGSGFLVSAPLLAGEAGRYAPLAMAALLITAFAIGAMIRFNIRHAEVELGGDGNETPEHRLHRGHHERTRSHWVRVEGELARPVEQLSHVVLAGAYVISVTYYLQLLSAFVLDRFGVKSLTTSRIITTSILVVLAAVGTAWGLRALERLETYAVSLNLGTIAALLLALSLHDGSLLAAGQLALPHLVPDKNPVRAGRTLMGLLIIVQGFETSRFLGSEHPREERVRTMRRAQLIASAIYLLFVTLMLPLFSVGLDASVTAIVHLVAPVAVILPTLLVVAAIGSQFSAAVADDAGCAGLTRTLFSRRLSSRWGYLAIGVATIALTWLTNVLSIISLASRAFALFYALQCAVAVLTAAKRKGLVHRRLIQAGGAALALLCLLVTIFGIPAG